MSEEKDIVERLKERVIYDAQYYPPADPLHAEAASEITRLRGEVERLREGLMPYLEKVANLANAMIASGDYVASGSLLKLTTAEAAALLSSAPKPEEG